MSGFFYASHIRRSGPHPPARLHFWSFRAITTHLNVDNLWTVKRLNYPSVDVMWTSRPAQISPFERIKMHRIYQVIRSEMRIPQRLCQVRMPEDTLQCQYIAPVNHEMRGERMAHK